MSEMPAERAPGSAEEAAVGAVLDASDAWRHLWLAPLLLGAIMLFDSWDSIAIAYAMPTLSAEWRLTPLTMGYVISAGYGGQFIGAIALGAVAERTGRMPAFVLAVAVMGALAIACALARDYAMLLTLRLLQGVMIGGAMPVAITYVNELAPARSRGFYFGLFQTVAISGFACASLSSPWVIPHLGWRWMLGLGAVPLVLLPFAALLLPESPRWLARTRRRDLANRALARLGLPEATFPAVADASTVAIKRPGMLVLAEPRFRSRTLTVTLLWFLTMFTSFGLTTWVPSIYVKVFHFPVQVALSYAAVTSISIFVALVCSGWMIDRFGRRPLALLGLGVTAVSLIFVGVHRPANELVLVSIIISGQVAIFFGAFVLWPYTAETYPTDVRALALGYGSSLGRGASMLTPLFVGFVLERGVGIGIVFVSFGIFALVALVVWLTRTSETRGRALEAI